MEKIKGIVPVVGGQVGDEGKGKIVDLLAENADMVIRALGGDNAGHTIYNQYGKHVTHLMPAGIFNPNIISVVAAGVALNPRRIVGEMQDLDKVGVSMNGLRISDRAHLVLAHHMIRDRLAEEAKGRDAIGTTGRGIGPCYSDKVNRIGLQAYLLKNPDLLLRRLDSTLKTVRMGLQWADLGDEFRADSYEEEVRELSHILSPYITDTGKLAREYASDPDKSILLEGNQGFRLDLDEGGYPFVTSTGTTAASLLVGAELPPGPVRTVLVLKAYQTRVGGGPMPTEMRDEQGETSQGINIRESAGEIGATTQRERRIANFDGLVAEAAYSVNDPEIIALTRLDSMSQMGDFQISNGYILDGKSIDYIPVDHEEYARCKPDYGDKKYRWDDDIKEVKDWHDFPAIVRDYTYDAVINRFHHVSRFLFGNGEKRDDVVPFNL